MNKIIKSIICCSLLILMSCSEKKVDANSLSKVNQLVENGKYEEALTLLTPLSNDFPNDENLKATQVRTLILYGNYLMFDSPLPPKEKYPGALKQYRSALEIDPTNSEANENIQMITSIYKSMGREIPN